MWDTFSYGFGWCEICWLFSLFIFFLSPVVPFGDKRHANLGAGPSEPVVNVCLKSQQQNRKCFLCCSFLPQIQFFAWCQQPGFMFVVPLPLTFWGICWNICAVIRMKKRGNAASLVLRRVTLIQAPLGRLQGLGQPYGGRIPRRSWIGFRMSSLRPGLHRSAGK